MASAAEPASGLTEAERIASAMSSIFELSKKIEKESSAAKQSDACQISQPLGKTIGTNPVGTVHDDNDEGHVYELAYLKAMVRKKPPTPPAIKGQTKPKNSKDAVEETEEEEKARMAFARKVYNRNLRTLVACLSDSRGSKKRKKKSNKRTLWKVKLNSFGEVLSVAKTSVSRCKPEPSCFIMIVKGNGKPPVIGTFEALTPTQQNVARCLKTDILKIANATEIAHTTPGRGKCETVDRIVEEHLNGFRERYGDLPPSRTAIAQQMESIEKAKRAKAEEEKEKQTEKFLNETPSFEELLQQMKMRR